MDYDIQEKEEKEDTLLMDSVDRDMMTSLIKSHDSNPLKYFSPNGAQQHWIKMIGVHQDGYEHTIETKGFDFHKSVIKSRNKIWSKSNKVGGTTCTINILGNLIWGPQNHWFDYPLYRDWPYPKRFWLISEDSSVKDIIVPQMKEWFPKNSIKNEKYKIDKKGKTWEYSWEFPGTGWSGVIKTMDLSGTKMESDFIGLAIISEPCEEELWKSLPSRMTGGGIRLMEMTPVVKTDSRDFLWVYDHMEDSGDLDIFYSDIEENCKEHGVMGVESHENIQWAVSQMRPDELEARTKGKCAIIGGRIFKHEWDEEKNVVPEFKQQKNIDYQYVMIIDPHESRPPAVIWASIDMDGGFTIIDEYPSYYPGSGYETYESCPHTISELCDIINSIEIKNGYLGVRDRIMDPFFGSKEYAASRMNVNMVYESHGLSCRFPKRQSIQAGIDIIRDMLKERKLRISVKCQNTIRHISKWAYRKTKYSIEYSERFKDYCDLLRYLVTADISYNSVKNKYHRKHIRDHGIVESKSKSSDERHFGMGI